MNSCVHTGGRELSKSPNHGGQYISTVKETARVRGGGGGGGGGCGSGGRTEESGWEGRQSNGAPHPLQPHGHKFIVCSPHPDPFFQLPVPRLQAACQRRDGRSALCARYAKGTVPLSFPVTKHV